MTNPTSPNSPTTSLRVLVVDDDRATRGALKRLLVSEGYEAEVCETAQEAMARLRDATFDVLLTDFVLPGVSGIALVEEARRSSPQTHCFIMSGQSRAESAPADVHWFGKPLDVDQLLAAIAA